ncbi:hypothetical protein IFM89_036786 [Coptis chinensis]|uniref:F-box domain-containing protein n=1 Tax=Coptis chinensis TaxID=261450 RepID=A0A835HSL7_9MAGN|nr:hypothetical protein IFM89_036786 [Coptis chinensis]
MVLQVFGIIMARRRKQKIEQIRQLARKDLKLYSDRGYAGLHFDIVSQILLRLPVEDLLRCKSVCTKWYELIKEPDFISMQVNNAICQPSRIILAPRSLYHRYRYEDPTNALFLIGKGKGTTIPVKNLKLNCYYRIAGSCNGLLCIASTYINDKPVYIYNPITRECKKLPEIDPKYFKTDGVLFGFGFDTIHKKYKVICVYRPYYWDTDYYEGNVTESPVTAGVIITEGESSWRQLEFPYQINFQYGSETVFLDGAFHWMIDTEDPRHPTSGSERILALDVRNEEFHTINIPPSIVLPDSLILINLAGYLAFVESTLDTSSQIWQIVGSETNGRQIFRYSCKCVSETDRLNYFCRLLNMSTDGCYYYQATERLQQYRSISQQSPKPCDHLALYNPEKDQSFFLNMHGIPRSFHTVFFTPTLVSPEAIYFPPKSLVEMRRNQFSS